MFTVKIDVSDAATILKNHGFNPGGRVQAFFTSEVMRKADPYVPVLSETLKNSARVSEDKCAIIYGGAGENYAHYQWEGKLYVDPITRKGAFYSPTYGFWSRPDVNKEKTDRDLNYNGAPLRGPRWVKRCWINEKENIIKSTEAFMRK